MKSWFKFCLSQLALTLFVGIVFLTLYAGAGRQYFPYISHLKPQLMQWLSQQSGQPVSIAQLQGSWSGLLPTVKVYDLRIGKSESPVQIGYMQAELDISSSLFYWRPVFKHLSINDVRINLEQIGKQTWRLGQDWIVDFSQTSQADNDWFSLLVKQQFLHFSNWHIRHKQLSGKVEKAKLDVLTWRNNGQQHSLNGTAKWGYKKLQPIEFKANITGSLWPYETPDGRFYIKVAKQDWSRWIPNLDNPNIALNNFSVSAKAWFRLEQGQIKSHHAIIDNDRILLKTAGKPLHIPKGKLVLAGLGDEQGWYSVIDTQFPHTQKWPKLYFYYHKIAQRQHGARLEVQKMSIDRVSHLLRTHKLLPSKIHSYLEGIKPQGDIQNLGFSYIYQAEKEPLAVLSMNLQEVSSQAHRGIPAFKHVSGKLVAFPDSGYFVIQDDLASIYIDEVYRHFLHIQQPQGQFAWRIQADGAELRLKQFTGSVESAPVMADMRLRIPDSDAENLSMGLKIGIRQAPLKLHAQFVPEVFVDAATRNWLASAILAGQGEDFKFILNGELGPKSRMSERTLLLDFKVKNGRLRYQEKWPEIAQIEAHFNLQDEQIHAQITQAKSAGLQLTDPADVRLNAAHPHDTLLDLEAKVQGDVAQGFAYLTETPLKHAIDNQLQGWFMQGRHRSQLQLGLRLGAKRELSKLQLASHLYDASLYIKPLDLTLSKLNGDIKYGLKTGLNSQWLQAHILGGKSRFKVRSKAKKQGFDMHIKGAGIAAWQNLHKWQANHFEKIITGTSQYQLDANIDLSARRQHQVNLSSNLQGSRIALPSPYGKQAQAMTPSKLKWHSNKQQSWLSLDYNQQINAIFKWQQQKLIGGQVRLDAQAAQLNEMPGIFVNGNIAHPVELEKWYQVWRNMVQTNRHKATSAQSPIRQFKFNFADIKALGMPLGSSFLAGTKVSDAWEIDFANRIAKGQVRINDQPTPIVLQLDYLHINNLDNIEQQRAEKTHDMLAQIDPYNLPDMDIWLAELYYNTRNLGHWQITTRAKQQGYLIDVEQGKIKQLNVQAQFLWHKQNNQMRTHMQAFKLTGDNLADSYRAFRLTPIIESTGFHLNATGSWLGSPANVQLKNLKSDIRYQIDKGRIDVKEAESLRGFGMLNVGAISRRLRLDFSDLYQSGLSFDEIKAKLKTEKGILTIKDPILIEGPSGKYQLSGTSNLVNETLDMEMAVTLPVSGSLPLFIVLAGLSPQVAGAVYITERLIGNELETFTSASYKIQGTWGSPKLTLNQVFDKEIEGTQAPSFFERVKRIFWLD